MSSGDDIFYYIPYGGGGYKQVALSQQQLYVINLKLFLNFNSVNLARFGIFLPKWLITYVCFTLHDAIKVNKDIKLLFN